MDAGGGNGTTGGILQEPASTRFSGRMKPPLAPRDFGMSVIWALALVISQTPHGIDGIHALCVAPADQGRISQPAPENPVQRHRTGRGAAHTHHRASQFAELWPREHLKQAEGAEERYLDSEPLKTRHAGTCTSSGGGRRVPTITQPLCHKGAYSRVNCAGT